MYLRSLAVVRLGLAVSASAAPVTGVALSGGADLSTRARPEPAIGIGRLEVWAVATSKVTFATRRPNVLYVSWSKVESIRIK